MTDNLYCYLHLGACRLDYGNPDNHQILSQTVLFNNVNQKAEQLSPAAFNDYLAGQGFVTYKSHLSKRLRYYQEKSVTPISLTVSLDLIGESVEFKERVNPDAKRYNDIHPTTPKPHEVTHGIDNMDTSWHGLARFLDSDYSIDTLITWLESKQFDIPLGVYAFANEIQKWQQVAELQIEAVENGKTAKNAHNGQKTTPPHTAKEAEPNTGTGAGNKGCDENKDWASIYARTKPKTIILIKQQQFFKKWQSETCNEISETTSVSKILTTFQKYEDELFKDGSLIKNIHEDENRRGILLKADNNYKLWNIELDTFHGGWWKWYRNENGINRQR